MPLITRLRGASSDSLLGRQGETKLAQASAKCEAKALEPLQKVHSGLPGLAARPHVIVARPAPVSPPGAKGLVSGLAPTRGPFGAASEIR